MLPPTSTEAALVFHPPSSRSHLTMSVTAESDFVKLTLGEDSVVVALKGATVISYIHQNAERLFASSLSDPSLASSAAVRGGVPVCWPIFGPPPADNPLYSKLKQHGFARTSTWEFVGGESGECPEGHGGVKAVFKLEPTESIRALFSLPFTLLYTVLLTPQSLKLTLQVQNPSSAIAPLPFQALLHTYFRLPELVLPAHTLVTPLENLSFADKLQGGAVDVERRRVVEVDGPDGEVDRVYYNAPDALKIQYKGRTDAVHVTKKGFESVVLWNPGPTTASKIADMEPSGHERYICLEPGLIKPFQLLDPGKEWEGSIEIECEA
ncbi:hypothetical protein JCM11251_004259 [Rhodosporidiobolus azoricus]